MHVIAPLASGLADAADGIAFVRRRGASTLATCYSSFEGDVLTQPATGLVLDSNGSKVVYVNELVDVEVQDSTGAAVREFVAGAAAPNVEVQSLAFLGTDYDSGASAAGNPTTLQAVLDKVLTSFGSTDWNVLLGGSAVSVVAALSSMYGIFYNVKGTQYGALGDGSTDDTTPIQNAITAAGTAGGGIVFFPKGTYRTTAKLTIPVGVSLWGCGGTVSVIKLDHGTADTLEYGTGTGYSPQEIRNLGIVAAQANTGIVVSMLTGNTRNVLITGCTINWDGTNAYYRGTALIKANATTHTLVVENSSIAVHTSTYPITGSETNLVTIRGTTFTVVSAAWTGVFLNACSNMMVSGCIFDMSATTSGAHYVWAATTTLTKVSFVGNVLKSGTASFGFFMGLSIDNASSFFVESPNTFSGFPTGAGISGTFWLSSAARPTIVSTRRDSSIYEVTSAATPLALSGGIYGMAIVTFSIAQTINLSGGPEGSSYFLVLNNSTGGALNITMGTGFITPQVIAVLGGKIATIELRSVFSAGNGAWMPVGSTYIQI